MSDEPKRLTRTYVTVELADGRILTARVINPDVIRYEENAERGNWPTTTVQGDVGTVRGTELKNTFCAYAALTRTKQYDGKWEDFRGRDCVEIHTHEEDVDPTPSAPADTSSPSSHGSDDGPTPSSQEPTTS